MFEARALDMPLRIVTSGCASSSSTVAIGIDPVAGRSAGTGAVAGESSVVFATGTVIASVAGAGAAGSNLLTTVESVSITVIDPVVGSESSVTEAVGAEPPVCW